MVGVDVLHNTWMLHQSSVLCDSSIGTRTRVWTQVHFIRTRNRVQFSSLWLRLGLGLRNRDSGPSHARVQAVVAVPCCAVYSDIRYILLFVFMFWKINKIMLNMWIIRFVTRTRIFFWCGLGLWGDDSDSDFEVMTRTRTQRWWLGLGLGFDNLDSDTALPIIHLIVVFQNGVKYSIKLNVFFERYTLWKKNHTCKFLCNLII